MSLNVAIIIVTIVMVIVGYFIVMSDWWHTLPQRPRTVIFAGADSTCNTCCRHKST